MELAWTAWFVLITAMQALAVRDAGRDLHFVRTHKINSVRELIAWQTIRTELLFLSISLLLLVLGVESLISTKPGPRSREEWFGAGILLLMGTLFGTNSLFNRRDRAKLLEEIGHRK